MCHTLLSFMTSATCFRTQESAQHTVDSKQHLKPSLGPVKFEQRAQLAIWLVFICFANSSSRCAQNNLRLEHSVFWPWPAIQPLSNRAFTKCYRVQSAKCSLWAFLIALAFPCFATKAGSPGSVNSMRRAGEPLGNPRKYSCTSMPKCAEGPDKSLYGLGCSCGCGCWCWCWSVEHGCCAVWVLCRMVGALGVVGV